MGIVFEAEQISLERTVALKVLPLAVVLDEQQIARFMIEAQPPRSSITPTSCRSIPWDVRAACTATACP